MGTFDHWVDKSNPVRRPTRLAEVDLFSYGAQEHWYAAYDILHREAPVQRLPGEGFTPGTDGYVLTKYDDVARVVRDPVRYKPTLTVAVEGILAAGRTPDLTNAMMESMATLRPTHRLHRGAW